MKQFIDGYEVVALVAIIIIVCFLMVIKIWRYTTGE